MPNPNELQRLEEELEELYFELRGSWQPRAQKEGILRQIRTIEKTLGIEPKSYNGGK